MSADCDKVYGGADEDEAVPDGVCEWYDAVAFEEHNSDHVDGTAGCQLVQTGHLFLYVEYNSKHTTLLYGELLNHTHANALTFAFHFQSNHVLIPLSIRLLTYT